MYQKGKHEKSKEVKPALKRGNIFPSPSYNVLDFRLSTSITEMVTNLDPAKQQFRIAQSGTYKFAKLAKIISTEKRIIFVMTLTI